VPEKPVQGGYTFNYDGVYMKRYLLIVTLLVATLSSRSMMAWTSVYKKGGVWIPERQIVGYRTVHREDNWLYTRITCVDGGPNECPDKFVASNPNRPPDQHTVVEDAGIEYAHSQISNGILSGNMLFSISGNNNVKRLVWNVSSALQEDGCIRIWVEGASDPGCQ
jgi:uncharacterized metal-binding protein